MRWAFLAIALLAALPCPAAVWTSNALMQTLDQVSSPPSSGYYLIEEGDVARLYLDGELVRTRTRNADSETTTENGVTTRRTFQDGRLSSESLADGTIVDYSYSEDGILERVSYTRDGNIERVVQYNYSPITGLAAVIDIESDNVVFYSGTAMSVREGEARRRLERSRLEREVVTGLAVSDEGVAEMGEDGNLTISEPYGDGQRITRYGESLVLLSETILDAEGVEVSTTSYSYDEDGHLSSSLFTEGDKTSLSTYTAGRITTLEETASGVPTLRREFQSDGTINETRYRNGREYALVRYDRDGVRVLDVRML